MESKIMSNVLNTNNANDSDTDEASVLAGSDEYHLDMDTGVSSIDSSNTSSDDDDNNNTINNNTNNHNNSNLAKLTKYWRYLPIGLQISFDNDALGDATYMQFREMPFVRLISELVRPTLMTKPHSQPGLHRFSFGFGLTHIQVMELASEQCEVVFRFGEFKRHQPQMDNLPEPISICVNNQSLPCGVIHGPINITTQIKLAREKMTSMINLLWVPDFLVQSCFSIELVRRLSVTEMFKRIQLHFRPKHITQKWVDTLLGMSNNQQIENHGYRCVNILLICPLSLQRMQYPCRASTCNHLDCFDALEYLNRVVHTNDWLCPVCHDRIMWEHMEIDEYFIDLINKWFPIDIVQFETPIPGDMTPRSDSQSDDDENIEYILP